MSDNLITLSKQAQTPSTIYRETLDFMGTKNIHKVSLDLTVVNSNLKNFVVGSNGILSFNAANFRESRNNWVWEDINADLGFLNTDTPAGETSGKTIRNLGQSTQYISSSDSANNAPYISYDLFFDTTDVYELWGRGLTAGGGIYWSFDDDVTDMRQMDLGSYSGPLTWTKFGVFSTKAGEIHTFTVYLGDAEHVLLDQWYFTTEQNLDGLISSLGIEDNIISPLSEAPFNTNCSINGTGGLATSWLSSKDIIASGKYNYPVQSSSVVGIDYTSNVTIDYSLVGGSSEHFAAWDFNPDPGGSGLVSTDHGQTFMAL